MKNMIWQKYRSSLNLVSIRKSVSISPSLPVLLLL